MASKSDKALLKAAEKGKLEAVQAALDGGADINCADAKGRTAVHLAVIANSVACVHELLSKGADPNLPDKNKEFPIHSAACFPTTDVLRVLIDTGNVNLESQNKDGNTALHSAAHTGRVDCVMYLTSKGADSKAQNNKYEIPAALARKKNHKGVLAVMKAAQLRDKTNSGGRPVSTVISHAENGMPLEPAKIDDIVEPEPREATSAPSAPSGGGPPPPPGGGPPPPGGGGPPPPPGGGPPPPGGGPPPPPGGAPNLKAGPAPGGGGMLGGIANAKLKKSPKPDEEGAKSSPGGGGGGGGAKAGGAGAAGGSVGGMMAEMMKKRNEMKKKQETSPSFTGPQLKQFEEDLMMILREDITTWKTDICEHFRGA
jgi:hypothetical protein